MLCFKAEFLVLMCASFYKRSYNFWQFNMNCYSKVKLHFFFQIIYNEYFLILFILTLLQQLFMCSSLKSLVSGRNCYIFLRLEKYPLPLFLLCIGQYMVIDLRFMHEEGAEISVHFSVKFVISPKTSSLCRSFTAP